VVIGVLGKSFGARCPVCAFLSDEKGRHPTTDRTETAMPDHDDTSLLIGELSGLARDKLRTQSGGSVALDAGALGLMLLDVALATTVLETEGAHGLWIAALALLVLIDLAGRT
jgi:hypothetical protein